MSVPKILYTATATAKGGREGHIHSSDGVLDFVMADQRIRFEASLAAAERSGVKLSARLLAVAEDAFGVGPIERDTGEEFRGHAPHGQGRPG